MTFKRFEDIQSWQLARELSKLVKVMSDGADFSKDWELKRQIRSSSGRIMDCIAEGYERGNNNEFAYFLGVALGSCGEVRSQGYRALDYAYISKEELEQLKALAIRTSAAIRALLDYLLKSENRGFRMQNKTKSPKTGKHPHLIPDSPYFPSTEPPSFER